MTRLPHMPELLAPAGDLACLHAAVCAGADAVYLGLDEFNARRNAGNFTIETLQAACEYAHVRGVAIYVTMNIEVLPSEIGRALDYASQAWNAGADAFIVQDIGLACEMRRALPEAPIHISTQMNTHNAAGVVAGAHLGASRITLARELSLAEIAELAALAGELGMEVECFAHGALCVCYSGQCLMSSMIGGRSANRGLCAQACRLPYELHRAGRDDPLSAEGEHLLSPRDLCTIDLLGDLSAAGVASLKIEGRMKSPDYVYAVTSVYREVLDAGQPATDAQKARLAEAFSRGFTTAYLEGRRGNDIMSYTRPNNRGVFAGRVARAEQGVAHIAPEIDLHVDDVLEFWTNRGHFAATVADAKRAADNTMRIAIDQRVGKGDRVFRVRNATMAFADDEFEPRVPVAGRITLRIGQPAHIEFRPAPFPHRTARAFQLQDSEGTGVCAPAAESECETGATHLIGEAEGPVVEQARTRAVTEQDVRDHVDRLGQTPFKLESLEIELDDNVGIGFSQLHHLRADALNELQTILRSSVKAELLGGRPAIRGLRGAKARRERGLFEPPKAASSAVAAPRATSGQPAPEPGTPPSVRHSGPSTICSVAAWATNPACARAAKRAGAEAVYVPLLNFRRGQAQLQGVRQDSPEQAGYPKQCVAALPTIDHDPVYDEALPTREAALSFDLWDYVRKGKPVFADNLGDAVRALECGALVEIGPHVPATNTATLQALAAMGVRRVWLSPELTLGQIADLAQSCPVPLGLVVAGAQELMVTEHCLLMSQGPCNEQCETCPRRSVSHFLRDRKGYDFPVVTDMLGRSHLYNGIELDAVPSIPDLVDLGISAVMVDTTLMSKQEAASATARVVRALSLAQSDHRGVQKRPHTTTGHLFRGVS